MDLLSFLVSLALEQTPFGWSQGTSTRLHDALETRCTGTGTVTNSKLALHPFPALLFAVPMQGNLKVLLYLHPEASISRMANDPAADTKYCRYHALTAEQLCLTNAQLRAFACDFGNESIIQAELPEWQFMQDTMMFEKEQSLPLCKGDSCCSLKSLMLVCAIPILLQAQLNQGKAVSMKLTRQSDGVKLAYPAVTLCAQLDRHSNHTVDAMTIIGFEPYREATSVPELQSNLLAEWVSGKSIAHNTTKFKYF
jgi:hypothetical protein